MDESGLDSWAKSLRALEKPPSYMPTFKQKIANYIPPVTTAFLGSNKGEPSLIEPSHLHFESLTLKASLPYIRFARGRVVSTMIRPYLDLKIGRKMHLTCCRLSISIKCASGHDPLASQMPNPGGTSCSLHVPTSASNIKHISSSIPGEFCFLVKFSKPAS
jgi:hypothetical protein